MNRRKVLPIGIDLGSKVVKLAQLRVRGHQVEMAAAGAAELPAAGQGGELSRPEALTRGIRALVKANPFKGRQCVISLPAQDTLLRHVKVPKVGPDRFAQELRVASEREFSCHWEDMVVRYEVVGETVADGEIRQEVLVIAAGRRELAGYLTAAESAGLEVTAVNVEASAVVECYQRILRQAKDSPHAVVFVDLGAGSTKVVLSRAGRIIFARNLVIGGGHLDQALADGSGASVEEAHRLRLECGSGAAEKAVVERTYELLGPQIDDIAGQVNQCLRYCQSVFKGLEAETAVFIGGAAQDRRLCQEIAKRLGLPAKMGDPLVGLARAGRGASEATLPGGKDRPDLSIAVGLSLGALPAA